MGIYNGKITGKLVSRNAWVGTRSEGPVYYILPTDEYEKWGEIPVRKKILRWMKEPVLHELIGEIITIKGEIIETKDTITMDYTEVVHNGKVIPASKKSGKVVISREEATRRIKELHENDLEK